MNEAQPAQSARSLPSIMLRQAVEDGELVFDHGEISKSIYIPLMEEETLAEGNESFEVVLYDPTCGATIGKTRRTMVSLMKDEGSCLSNQFPFLCVSGSR